MSLRASDLAAFKIDASDAKKALVKLQKDFDRATMYGIRAAGRSVKQRAKAAAPVYDGDDPRAVPGRLKASIHTSKRLRKPAPGTYVNHIGPWGGRVNLYRNKIEQDQHYMADGYTEAVSVMQAKFTAAYERVLARAGRL